MTRNYPWDAVIKTISKTLRNKNMKRFLVILLLSCQYVLGQGTDKSGQDSDKLNSLYKLIDEYTHKDSAKAFGYARSGLSLAEKEHNDPARYIFYRKLGIISK